MHAIQRHDRNHSVPGVSALSARIQSENTPSEIEHSLLSIGDEQWIDRIKPIPLHIRDSGFPQYRYMFGVPAGVWLSSSASSTTAN